jgi:hypothetical protein
VKVGGLGPAVADDDVAIVGIVHASTTTTSSSAMLSIASVSHNGCWIDGHPTSLPLTAVSPRRRTCCTLSRFRPPSSCEGSCQKCRGEVDTPSPQPIRKGACLPDRFVLATEVIRLAPARRGYLCRGTCRLAAPEGTFTLRAEAAEEGENCRLPRRRAAYNHGRAANSELRWIGIRRRRHRPASRPCRQLRIGFEHTGEGLRAR